MHGAQLDGAGPTTEPPRPRVAIIGWDAATWEVLDPLLADGSLPRLASLIARGSRGILRAEPPLLSPALWTTLATGFPPEEHGVRAFVLQDPARPDDPEGMLASSIHRRRAPLWRMVSVSGRDVGIAGWWATWPAEPVRGWLVTDHLAYNRWDAWARRGTGSDRNLVFPAELEAELAAHAVPPAAVDGEAIAPLVAFDETEMAEMMAADRPQLFHAPSVFRFGYATDASNMAFARHLLDSRGQPDLLAVVLVLGDVAGHVFWHHYRPESVTDGDGDLGRLGDAIPAVHRQLDAWTGEILDRLDASTTVVVLSDHGMGGSGRVPRPGHNPAGDHTPDGIVVVAGPAVPVGRDLGVIPQIDLAPTVLRLLDLPLARDMPGRPRDDWLAAPPSAPEWVDSYGDGREAGVQPAESPGDDAYRERLRALGYIE
jgi:hypothetical protein